MYKDVHDYLAEREKEFDQIPLERRALLKKLADFARSRQDKKQPARFLFICTHNSRRSHLGQVWTAAAAAYYGLPAPSVHSGGTEATAFNARAVAALERAGMKIEKTTADDNPVYHVRFSTDGPVLTAFSKVFSHAPNPTRDYCAVMVCSSADEACPNVPGAALRIAIPYEDPKQADGTPSEAKAYDERCRQIAREMLYAQSLIRTDK